MISVQEACRLLDDMESARRDGSCENADVQTKLAERIVELEKTLIEVGVEDSSQEMDTVEKLCEYMQDEFNNVLKWLEIECMDYSDWDRNNAEVEEEK